MKRELQFLVPVHHARHNSESLRGPILASRGFPAPANICKDSRQPLPMRRAKTLESESAELADGSFSLATSMSTKADTAEMAEGDMTSEREAPMPSGTRRWPEQYARMKRVLARARSAPPISEQAEDDYYAFFVWCYHLKDWLKNDDSIPSSVGDRVERYVKDKRCLGICGALANGIKHLRRDRG